MEHRRSQQRQRRPEGELMTFYRPHVHVAGLARISAFSGCVLAAYLATNVLNARAEGRETTMRLARELGSLGNVFGPQTRLRINGNVMFAAGSHVDLPMSAALDRFEESCGKSTARAAGSIEPFSSANACSRAEGNGVGGVLCFLDPRGTPSKGVGLVERARAFMGSGDAMQWGDMRYLSARTNEAGGTDVITVSTEGTFDFSNFMAADRDVPGTDIPGVPRPPGSIRALDLQIDDGQYGLKSYMTAESPEDVMSRYSKVLAGLGWAVVETNVPQVAGTTFVKRAAAITVSVQHEGDRTRVDLLQIGSRGVTD
jgi:hypothetical protein